MGIPIGFNTTLEVDFYLARGMITRTPKEST